MKKSVTGRERERSKHLEHSSKAVKGKSLVLWKNAKKSGVTTEWGE